MRIARRLLTLALAASGLLIAGASTATAGVPYPSPRPSPYPIPSVVITINKTIIVQGDVIIVSGCNFQPGENVNVVSAFESSVSGQGGRSARSGLRVDGDGTTVANNIGCFSFNVHPDKAGKHHVDAVGSKSGRHGSADVRVLDANATAGGSGELPVTGNDGSNVGILLVGSSVAATGIVLLVLARSRRRPTKMDS